MPAILLLLIWWKQKKINWVDVRNLLPFCFVAICLGLVTIYLERIHVGAEGQEWELSIIERFLIAGRVFWFYIGKLLLPVKLTFIYPRWKIDTGAIWQYLFVIATLVVVLVLFFSRKHFGFGPLVGILIFGGILVPALGFFNVYPMRYSFVADHFQYHASTAFIALIVALCSIGIRRLNQKRVSFVVLILVVGLLVSLTWRQCYVYRNQETLWYDVIEKNPNSWMAHNNLGNALQKKQKFDEAIKHYKTSIELKPDHTVAIYNLGNSYYLKGQTDLAVECLAKSIEQQPNFAAAYFSLANIYKSQIELKKAIENYEKTIEINNDFTSAHFNLANTYKSLGQIDKAIYHYEQTLRSEPEHGKAHYQLAISIKSSKRIEETVKHLNKAVELLPDSPLVLNELAWILATYPDDRIRDGQRALALAQRASEMTNNENLVILDTLASAYAEVGRYEEALKTIKKALSITSISTPKELSAHLRSQRNLFETGKPAREGIK
jgi:tetratricopeptide (TPR) repeat protein